MTDNRKTRMEIRLKILQIMKINKKIIKESEEIEKTIDKLKLELEEQIKIDLEDKIKIFEKEYIDEYKNLLTKRN